MKKKKYTISTDFSFKGEFYIMAETRQDAVAIFNEHCGMLDKSGVYCSHPDAEVTWDFPVSPNKKTYKKTQKKIRKRRVAKTDPQKRKKYETKKSLAKKSKTESK